MKGAIFLLLPLATLAVTFGWKGDGFDLTTGKSSIFVGAITLDKTLTISVQQTWTFASGSQFNDITNEIVEMFTCLKIRSNLYECVLQTCVPNVALSGKFDYTSLVYTTTSEPTGMIDDTVPSTNFKTGNTYTRVLSQSISQTDFGVQSLSYAAGGNYGWAFRTTQTVATATDYNGRTRYRKD
mmetsp:Transcript_27097/g.33636  ORF Transcript_27097/g.33636 Transcript_27097/m.33636 type:complete len:183 (+) Transcript_27097:1-549(+)